MTRLRHLLQLLRYLGPRWLSYRLTYQLHKHSGRLAARLPVSRWSSHDLESMLVDPQLAVPKRQADYRRESAPRFFMAGSDAVHYRRLLSQLPESAEPLRNQLEEVQAGKWRLFGGQAYDVGIPPDWHRYTSKPQRADAQRHWSRIDDFAGGDLKLVWEPNRFAVVFLLVRGYWQTGDDHLAELFWQLVEDWRRHNPPQGGANWKCGQEVALRVLAWCFGLYGFLHSPQSSPERITQLTQMIAVSGQRIAANLDYALSQRNNHAVSEAAGLWTIGSLFPELREAARWRDLGRELLSAQAGRLIYSDGAFSQHSMNYQRLMLHVYLWSMRLAELHGRPFGREVYETIRRAGEFLYHMQDEATGRLPHYGQDDGALVLPLGSSARDDFRPVIQAVHYLTRRQRCYTDPIGSEELLWLFGPKAWESPISSRRRGNLQATEGGYYTLRSPAGFAFTRAGHFRHRPSQADCLHVDIWWRGQNIALDPGTYSYNAEPPWNNPLAHTAYHNTVTVDGHDQMQRVSRFLWLPWARSRATSYAASKSLACWEGFHDGYRRIDRGGRHRRAIVRLFEDHWLVVDRLDLAQPRTIRLHWQLGDWPYRWDEPRGRLMLETPQGDYHLQTATLRGMVESSVVRGDPTSPRGWRAPTYMQRAPIISLQVKTRSRQACLVSLLGPTPAELDGRGKSLSIDWGETQADVALGEGKSRLVRSIRLNGRVRDVLECD